MNNNDLLETYQADGTVVSSAQFRFKDVDEYRNVVTPMEGIIVEVAPSDDPNNLSAASVSSKRGFRHECTVLVTDDYGSPYLLLENVVIPPGKHSGVDDYEEDLPRGVMTHIDKQQLTKHWKNIDIARLDGEHCVVSFIGGCLDKPFISNWWPHPANRFDPATSGQACLSQADPKKNQSRAMRRVNGVLQLVTKEGDVYFDTNEASSVVDITSEKGTTSGYRRLLKDKGGSVQINIKPSKQLEINWNTPVEGLKAGSTSAAQDREVDLPHIDHAKALAAYQPPKRETSSSFLRYKQTEMFHRTSNFTVSCEEAGSTKGEYVVAASDSINLYVRKGTSDSAVTIHTEKGKIQFINSDGSQINILDDEIQIVTKSGGLIYVNGSKIAIAGKVDISGPVAVGGTAGQPVVNAATYQIAEAAWLTPFLVYLKAQEAAWTAIAALVPPVAPLAALAKTSADALQVFVQNLQLANASPFTTKNLTSS